MKCATELERCAKRMSVLRLEQNVRDELSPDNNAVSRRGQNAVRLNILIFCKEKSKTLNASLSTLKPSEHPQQYVREIRDIFSDKG